MTEDTTPEQVERYKVLPYDTHSTSAIPSKEGNWVRYSDYAALSAERDALKARAEAAEGKLATLSPLLEARKGEQCVTPDYIENVPYNDWPEWLTGDSWLTPIQRLRAAEAEVARLQDVLRKIADGRGVCSHCGREAEGVGGGVVMCADHHNCNWSLPSSETRARAALQKENKT
jgi:hypothetical protein